MNISNATNNNNIDGKNRKILKFPTKENKINMTDSGNKYNFLLTFSYIKKTNVPEKNNLPQSTLNFQNLFLLTSY